MLDLDPIKNVYFVLAFLVPGLIASFIRAQFVTGRMPSPTEAALPYLAISVIYYALVFPAIDYAIFTKLQGYRLFLLWFSLVFIGPAIFGFLLGLNTRLGLARKILAWFGLNPVHAVPTAWDWKFGRMEEQWILAVLKNGTKFAGFFGAESFVSSVPTERDIYIERVYEVNEQDEWNPRENGILIAPGEVSTIEFWPLKFNGEDE